MHIRQLPKIGDFYRAVFKRSMTICTGSECWLWTGNIVAGRARFWMDGQDYIAARVAWAIHDGKDPYPEQVLHNCPNGDNKLCVNPAHLYLGTHSTIRDRSHR